MRILFIVEHYYPYIGGAEELWKTLAEQLVRESHEVTVLTTRFDKNLSETEEINGVKICRLNVGNRYGFTFFSIRRAISLAKNVDIIHTSSYNAAFPAWLASKITSTRCIITFHEVWGKLWFKLPDLSWALRNGYFLFEKMLLNLSFDKFVAVSNFTLKALRAGGVSHEKSILIYNGLDYDNFEGYEAEVAQGNFIFCYFGRLGLSKGYQYLIPAFAHLQSSHPDTKLKLIVPRHPSNAYEKLKKQAADFEVEKSIIWLHDLSKEELYSEVAVSNAVVIPSMSEGFCFVAAEAVALKVPIISSQRGALQEVVGGEFIEIRELDEKEVFKAFELALNGKWIKSSPKLFPISDTVSNYILLYKDILGIEKEV